MIPRLKRQTKKRHSVKRQRMEMYITFADLAAGVPNFRYRPFVRDRPRTINGKSQSQRGKVR